MFSMPSAAGSPFTIPTQLQQPVLQQPVAIQPFVNFGKAQDEVHFGMRRGTRRGRRGDQDPATAPAYQGGSTYAIAPAADLARPQGLAPADITGDLLATTLRIDLPDGVVRNQERNTLAETQVNLPVLDLAQTDGEAPTQPRVATPTRPFSFTEAVALAGIAVITALAAIGLSIHSSGNQNSASGNNTTSSATTHPGSGSNAHPKGGGATAAPGTHPTDQASTNAPTTAKTTSKPAPSSSASAIQVITTPASSASTLPTSIPPSITPTSTATSTAGVLTFEDLKQYFSNGQLDICTLDGMYNYPQFKGPAQGPIGAMTGALRQYGKPLKGKDGNADVAYDQQALKHLLIANNITNLASQSSSIFFSDYANLKPAIVPAPTC